MLTFLLEMENVQIWRPFDVVVEKNDNAASQVASVGFSDITQNLTKISPISPTKFHQAISDTANTNSSRRNGGNNKISTPPTFGANLHFTRKRTKHDSKNECNSHSNPLATSTTKPNTSENADNDDDHTKGYDNEKSGDDRTHKKKKKCNFLIIPDYITELGGELPMYQCNVCKRKFKTKAHINYHEFCQKREKPFICEQCSQGFIVKSHYEYHLRTHTGEKPYVCPKCGKEFNQRSKVTTHMRSHTGEKRFICQECNRGFFNAQALRSHTLIHTGKRPFACTYCSKCFTGMTNLKKHVIIHTGERPFSCNQCGKNFGVKWTLDLHLKTHSGERPYSCSQCSRSFAYKMDLRRHLVTHTDKRPFKCWMQKCDAAFQRKDNLSRHLENVHEQPKEVAKKLSDEAALEYLIETRKAQLLGNISSSKLGSASSITEKADNN